MAKATSKPAPDAAPKSDVLYICTRHVNHNNTDYEQGDAIELTDKQAESLLDCGAVEVKPE